MLLFQTKLANYYTVTKNVLIQNMSLKSCYTDPEVVHQVDGLGRDAAMYCVHGNTPDHTECLKILITADCDLNLQANGNLNYF